MNLWDWSRVMEGDLGFDQSAIEGLIALSTSDIKGYQEACRILHHAIKDSDRSKEDPSRWLRFACVQANQALADHHGWNWGEQSWASSSSSGMGKDLGGKGKDLGGKGNDFGKGKDLGKGKGADLGKGINFR